MTEIPAGKAASFEDGGRRIVFHGDVEIGVFRWEDSSTPTKISVCTKVARRAKG